MSPNQQCLKSGAFSRTAFSFKEERRSAVGFDHWTQLDLLSSKNIYASGFPSEIFPTACH